MDIHGTTSALWYRHDDATCKSSTMESEVGDGGVSVANCVTVHDFTSLTPLLHYVTYHYNIIFENSLSCYIILQTPISI